MTSVRRLENRRVRIIAPSSPYPPARLARGVSRLEELGFSVEGDDPLTGSHAYLNGSDAERARALEEALTSNVDVVWLARGGYGLTRILSALALPPTPWPIVVGFSDATAFFAKARQHGARCVHGPLATSLADEPADAVAHLKAVLEGHVSGRAVSGLAHLAGPSTSVEGWAFAANLCVLSHLVGTPHLPSFDGAVLFVEEVGERPYRIDRMLTQLVDAGAFNGVNAVVVGHLTGCTEGDVPKSSRDPAPAPHAIFAERLSSLGVPVVSGFPSGHEAPNYAIPVGANVRVDNAGTVTFLEELFG